LCCCWSPLPSPSRRQLQRIELRRRARPRSETARCFASSPITSGSSGTPASPQRRGARSPPTVAASRRRSDSSPRIAPSGGRPSAGSRQSARALPRRRSAARSAHAAARRSASPAASRVYGPMPRTASTSASSRWAPRSGGCSVTARRRRSRRARRTATSWPRDATGARGPAGPGRSFAPPRSLSELVAAAASWVSAACAATPIRCFNVEGCFVENPVRRLVERGER
jgi:hypothetical protein